MSLSHWISRPVTIEPVGTLPVIVMVVDVTVGDVYRTRADGTVKKSSYEKLYMLYYSCLPKRTVVVETVSLTRSVGDVATIDMV